MVFLIVGPVLGGVLIGYLRGGRIGRLARFRIRAAWILWLVAALQVWYFHDPQGRTGVESRLGMSLLVPIFGAAGVWVFVNLRRRPRAVRIALLLILAGGVLNSIVAALNNGMPHSVVAAGTSRQVMTAAPKHVAIGDTTRAVWLADVIPVPPLGAMVSAGDLLLFTGVAALVATAMQDRAVRSRQGFSQAGLAVSSDAAEPGGERSAICPAAMSDRPGTHFAGGRNGDAGGARPGR